MSNYTLPKIFVPHVKKGYEDREAHITQMLGDMGIEFEFVLDGDIADLTMDRLDKYFEGPMHTANAFASCGCKHLLIYERMRQQNIASVLVLEDDIFLSSNFMDVFGRTMQQTKDISEPFYVGLEATCLRMVPRSERRTGVVIYPANTTQCTGAYYCNLAYANAVLDHIETHKCDKAIDLYLGSLGQSGVFKIFWGYPVIATQGSHNGKMESSIDTKGHNMKLITKIKRSLVMSYKKILYLFR